MKRIGTIDLLKFVLAVVIVLHHYQQVTGVRFSGWNFYGGTIYFGYAVEFFFIISGFFSVSGILAHPDERFKSYFMRKAVRLYPMTVLSVLATAGLMVIYRTVRGGWFLDIVPGLWRMLNSMLLTHTGGVFLIWAWRSIIPHGISASCLSAMYYSGRLYGYAGG